MYHEKWSFKWREGNIVLLLQEKSRARLGSQIDPTNILNPMVHVTKMTLINKKKAMRLLMAKDWLNNIQTALIFFMHCYQHVQASKT